MVSLCQASQHACYINALCYGVRSVCTTSEVLPDATTHLPAGFATGGKETQVAKVSNRECGCVLPRSCPSQKTEGRTSSTFPLKPPAPGALLVLGEWTYFSEVQIRENTFFYLVSYFSPCMFLWHSKAIWQARVRNIWNYLNFYKCFSFCIDLVKKVIKVMLYK